jgi:hypothetical protein
MKSEMERWMRLGAFMLLIGLFTLACSRTVEPADSTPASPEIRTTEVILRDRGPAPELLNDVWLNTEFPLRIAGLRGSVILLDFWTFG